MQLIRNDPTSMVESTEPIMQGLVRYRVLVDVDRTEQLRIQRVRFEAGGRNRMHTHDFDQVLYILDGEGIVATGTEEHRVRTGDVVVIPAGERHWHGGTATTALEHLAIGHPGVSIISEEE